MTVSQVDALYKQEGRYTGYYKIGNDYYCLKEDGTPRTGEINSEGRFFFREILFPARSLRGGNTRKDVL